VGEPYDFLTLVNYTHNNQQILNQSIILEILVYYRRNSAGAVDFLPMTDWCHCEERSSLLVRARIASAEERRLAMTVCCHCEERSSLLAGEKIASAEERRLAMTDWCHCEERSSRLAHARIASVEEHRIPRNLSSFFPKEERWRCGFTRNDTRIKKEFG
jgi:hypothetical protein